MMNKVKLQPYLVLRSKKDHDQYIANVVANYIAEYMKPHRKDAFDKGLDAGTTYGLDMAIIALGRVANGVGVEHRCENCLRYNRTCIHDEEPGPCEEHTLHGEWTPKPIDISDHDFFIEFIRQIGEAAKDYGELFDIDLEENHDDQYWWSGSKLDKELYEYVSPDIYPSFEERYKRETAKPAENTVP